MVVRIWPAGKMRIPLGFGFVRESVVFRTSVIAESLSRRWLYRTRGRSPVSLELVHNPISSRNGVGLFLWSAVSLKNMRMRFARVVATYTTRRLSSY